MAITYHAGRRIQGIAGVDVADSFTSSTDAHSAALSLGGGSGSGNTKVGFEVQTGHFLVNKGLKTLTFALDRYNPVSGNGYVAVYNSSGTQKGDNSSTYNFANLTQYPSPVDYTFTWTTPIIIDNGDRIVLEGGTFNTSNQVDLWSRNVSASEQYVNGVYFNSGWTSLSGTDVHFDVTTETNNGDTKPTNVQVGSRYEETDTRKMYHYTAPQAATDDIFSTGTGWSGDTSTYPYNSTINGIGCDTSTLGEAVTKTVTTLSASGQWVLRFKVTRETGDLGDGVMINLGSSSASTSSLARMQNGNGLYPYGIHLIYFSNGNTVNAGGSHNASFAWDSSSTTSVTWSVGDSRWIEVSHPSSSAFTTKVYSNANFTGTADLTNVASTSGQTLNYDDITIGTKWTANRKHIDFEDMQIWNGVTTAPSTSNTWEEEGT